MNYSRGFLVFTTFGHIYKVLQSAYTYNTCVTVAGCTNNHSSSGGSRNPCAIPHKQDSKTVKQNTPANAFSGYFYIQANESEQKMQTFQ